MPEHAIQLRKAWLERPRLSHPRRLDLPLPSPPDRILHITRAFGRPPIDPARETLSLRLQDIPGLSAVLLNAQVLWQGPADANTNTLNLALPPDLPARNLLELQITPCSQHATTPWGRIALVVHS
jgi:hypothetical protein